MTKPTFSAVSTPLPRPHHPPPPSDLSLPQARPAKIAATTSADDPAWANAQALYPVYFDASRSRADGRRVASELAIRSPLARQIVDACASLGLHVLFEPTKTHPKDWSNPGRVKVRRNPRLVHNKHHLYRLVAAHLAAHPLTGDDSPLLHETLAGGPPAPPLGQPYPRPAVPRGWQLNEFLPYYSPAMTGGGVSENLFKDMMRGMQGGGDMAGMLQQAAAAGGAGPSGAGGGGDGEGGKKGKKGKAKK